MTMMVYNTRIKLAGTNFGTGYFYSPVHVLGPNPARRRLAISVRDEGYPLGVGFPHPVFSITYGKKAPVASRFVLHSNYSMWTFSGIVCENLNENYSYVFDTTGDPDHNIFYAEPPGSPFPTTDVWVGVWAETLDGFTPGSIDVAVLTDAR